MENKGEIIMYQPNEEVRLGVRLENETVWLTQAQIAQLFGTGRQAITKHLKNIFASQELDEDSVCSILELTAADGKNYKTKVYNLDAILSVGYRVNSKNATLFRRWSNQVLKEYLLRGYSINQRQSMLICKQNLVFLCSLLKIFSVANHSYKDMQHFILDIVLNDVRMFASGKQFCRIAFYDRTKPHGAQGSLGQQGF